MKIKTSHQKPWLFTVAKQGWTNQAGRLVGLVLYTMLVFFLGIYLYRKGVLSEVKPFVTQNVAIIPKMVRGMLAKPEKITIDIKYEDFMKLAKKRDEALKIGLLISSSDDFVPAKIRYNEKTIDVKIRLKGDLTDHLEGEKWSYRIRVKGDNTLFGMKEFSIQHPKTRNYLYEWLYYQALRRESLLSLRYDFIEVILNGKNLGVYALEEHFDTQLIENNHLREGPILRFNDDLCWADALQNIQILGGYSACVFFDSSSYLSSDVDGFQTQKWVSDPATFSQYKNAIHLLESFRRGNLKTSEVFDVEKFAKLLAISDLMGAQHGVNWRNIRFYYNPVTSRLEPIGFDANEPTRPNFRRSLVPTAPSIETTDQNVFYYHYYFWESLFSDYEFYKEYLEQLERISDPSYLNNFFSEVDEELNHKLDIIYREEPDYIFSTDVFYQIQRFIRRTLYPTKGLQAYFHLPTEHGIELELGSIQSLPVQVVSLSYQDTTIFPATDEKIILPGKNLSQPVEFRNVAFTLPEGFVWSETIISDLKINYRVLGVSKIKSEIIFPYSHLDNNFAENDLIRKNPNVHRFDFLVVEESTKRIFIKPGAWNLNRSLIIPAGYMVIAEAGTSLNLSNSAKILSYSPIQLTGSEENPIVIQSKDSSGQGIVVMNAGGVSILEQVIFQNLSNPSQNGWELTGAVTFYESPVEIFHTQFVENRSEDALNIIRSDFKIDTSLFSHTFSDAFDADFATGKVINSSFISSGNDAIDVSGSEVDLENIFIDGAGDKGISVGEFSRVTAKRIDISNVMIAVASKDLSKLTIADLNVQQSHIGITAYQKKSEFGPGNIQATKVKILNTDSPYLVEKGSTVSEDGLEIQASQEGVFNIIYGQQ